MNEAFNRLLQHPDFPEGSAWQCRRFAAGETILEEGDNSGDLYLMKEGSARVIGSVGLDEQRKIRPGIFELGTGSLFGEISLFDQEPRSASVVAATDCQVIAIDRRSLLEFMEIHPEIGYHLLKEIMTSLVTRLRTANKRLAYLFAWGLKAHNINEHL